MKRITKLLGYFSLLFYSIPTLYFNFHYLPFRQAIYLPILFYRPKFGRLKGKVEIIGNVQFGMIRLGFPNISLYPNNGIYLEIKGGTLRFYGKCFVGNNSSISINKNGLLEIGDHFSATTTLKICSHYHIKIENDVLCGWETTIVDTDFHRMTFIEGKEVKPYGFVKIGHHSWLAMQTLILKGTKLSPYTVVAARSVCNRNYNNPECSLLAGLPAKIKAEGVFLDRKNMNIEFDFNTRQYEQ